ncbi:MAG: sensor histidine kinase [Candidatus Binatia bacterium]
MTFFILAIGGVGFFTLATAPALFFGATRAAPLTDATLHRIGPLALDPTFSLQLPEFFAPSEERAWWRLHEQVYATVMKAETITVEWRRRDGASQLSDMWMRSVSPWEALHRTWLIYLVAVIYLVSALTVFQRHRGPPAVVLTFFFLACALYFTSVAPIIARPLTLQPPAFRLLISTLHIAAGGLITLAHFAVVFPEPKPFLQRHPWFLWLLYGYFGLASVLYLMGVTAFGTTFPFFCLWIVVIAVAFVHSLLTEPDPFVKKQIRLSLMAPVLASMFFVVFFILPGILRLPPIRFSSFALFSLILPFALPLAMDNLALYHDRLAAERRAETEKNRFRRDLHDLILNKLATISLTATVPCPRTDITTTSLQERLQTTRRLAVETAREIRDFLPLLDEHAESWETLCGQLRQWSYELFESSQVDFTLEISPEVYALPPSAVELRVCLQRVYREALLNVIRHAQAETVRCQLFCHDGVVVCEIRDNGVGFDPSIVRDGHYGLTNMCSRVAELGGSFGVETSTGAGTLITFQLPVP